MRASTRKLITPFAIALVLCLTGTTIAQSVQIRLADGSRWRGQADDAVVLTVLERGVEMELAGSLIKVDDMYVVLETNIAGVVRNKTIFKSDILAMKTASAGSAAERDSIARSRPGAETDDVPRDASGRELGVFVLPMSGPVGESFRHQEILKMGEKADEYGPGQIIVLLISSNGGSSYESTLIEDAIYKVRERHRVVAWVEKAISAGCSTAMCCDEMYFVTEGTAGSVTTWHGNMQSLQGEEGEAHMEKLVDTAKRNGYSEHVARAMKFNRFECSYDKDSATGEVQFYGDLSGEYRLSDSESNLCFNATDAAHCGFSKGTADTEAELAALLDLPRWHEISDSGRRMAKEWQETVEDAKNDIPRLIAQRGYKNQSLDIVARLGTLIQIDKQLLQWIDRCPNVAEQHLGPAEQARKTLQREIVELRKQLADLR